MSKITKSAAKERIEQLRKEINGHNYNYYVLNAPVIAELHTDQDHRLKTFFCICIHFISF